MENRIAFIIPIYPPDYKYSQKILSSYKEFKIDEQADLYFVFTNEEDADAFGEYENKIILAKKLRNFQNRGFINIKKFYALKQLREKYDYLIVLDSEMEFIKNVDIKSICERFFDEKILYGNRVWEFQSILENEIKTNCQKYFKTNKNYYKIAEREGDLYLWFNNMPIYKTDTLDEFFQIIDYKNNIDKYSWEDFDYYIYMYYLIVYHDFNVKDCKMFGLMGAAENIPEGFCYRPEDVREIPKFKMCTKSLVEKFDNEDLFIAVHLDRGIEFALNILASGMMRLDKRNKKRINSLKKENTNLNKKIKKLKKQVKEVKNKQESHHNNYFSIQETREGYLSKKTLTFLGKEYVIKEEISNKVPFSELKKIEIEIFSYCNRQCWFCPNSLIDRHSENIIMDEDLYLKILYELQKINFSGQISYSRYNEPLSHFDIFLERLYQAREILPNALLHTNTNGDFLKKPMLKQLYDAGLRSLDIQSYLREDEEFNRRNIRAKIEKRAANLDVKCNIVKYNTDMVEGNFKYKDMNLVMRARDFRINGNNRAGSLETIKPVKREKPCWIPFKDIYIDYNGNLMPCCNMRSDVEGHKKFIMGNVNNNSLEEIFNNENYKKMRDILKKDNIKLYPCNECNFD